MKKFQRLFLMGLILVSAAGLLTGCKVSKKKVLESEYYKELKEKYNKLKKKNKQLKAELAEKDEPTENEQRASDYLDKIARDSLVKLEVGYYDNMEGSEFVEVKASFDIAVNLAKNADLTSNYTPKELEKEFDCIYEYVLYDEDNAVYEIMVYEGDYIVFSDLPNNVYYSYDASILGDAFLHYKNGYPNSRLLHRLADSALITSDEGTVSYDNRIAVKAANAIDQMEKTASSEKKAEKVWKQEAQKEGKDYKRPDGEKYTFYHHGNRLYVTVYDKFFSIRNMDQTVKWYQADSEDVKKLKNIFKNQ